MMKDAKLCIACPIGMLRNIRTERFVPSHAEGIGDLLLISLQLFYYTLVYILPHIN